MLFFPCFPIFSASFFTFASNLVSCSLPIILNLFFVFLFQPFHILLLLSTCSSSFPIYIYIYIYILSCIRLSILSEILSLLLHILFQPCFEYSSHHFQLTFFVFLLLTFRIVLFHLPIPGLLLLVFSTISNLLLFFLPFFIYLSLCCYLFQSYYI